MLTLFTLQKIIFNYSLACIVFNLSGFLPHPAKIKNVILESSSFIRKYFTLLKSHIFFEFQRNCLKINIDVHQSTEILILRYLSLTAKLLENE